ncbi:MAG: VWA domain-containing protein [Thermoleophilia bacterium]
MSFAAPLYLLALTALPLLVLAYILLDRRRALVQSRFASPALFPELVARPPGLRRHPCKPRRLQRLVGLARPQALLSAPSEKATIVLAIDTSRSMAARDVRPSRLEAAKRAALSFLQRAPAKYRVGVVAFATDARVVAPPTHDRQLVAQALAELRPGEGTALGDAVVKAVQISEAESDAAFGPASPTAVLLLSDGVQEGGQVRPEAAARLAAERGVRVSAVSLGTPEGVVEVPLAGGFRQRVHVPPDPATLEMIAARTKGMFFRAPTVTQLEGVYRDLASRLGSERKWREVTVAFAGGGLALLLLSGALSLLWFRRVP